MAGKKLCLLDRDGVLNVDKAYLHKAEDVEWIPGSLEAIAWLKKQGILVAVVTNQSGVARGYFTEDTVRKLHAWMQAEMKKSGGEIAAFYYCPHLPGAAVKQYDFECKCRKPKPGMILQALNCGCTSQVSLAPGKRSRNTATKGNVCNTSPSELIFMMRIL